MALCFPDVDIYPSTELRSNYMLHRVIAAINNSSRTFHTRYISSRTRHIVRHQRHPYRRTEVLRTPPVHRSVVASDPRRLPSVQLQRLGILLQVRTRSLLLTRIIRYIVIALTELCIQTILIAFTGRRYRTCLCSVPSGIQTGRSRRAARIASGTYLTTVTALATHLLSVYHALPGV